MIAALPAPETTASRASTAVEVREWEFAEEADDMRHATTMSALSEAVTPPVTLDYPVRQLVEGIYDEPEDLMAYLQDELRRGNFRICEQLANVAVSSRHDVEARSLALETLAAARVRAFENIAAEAVRVALDEPNPRLQFAGIAAVSDLSRRHQIPLSRIIREMVNSPATSPAVKRAGSTFLRRRS